MLILGVQRGSRSAPRAGGTAGRVIPKSSPLSPLEVDSREYANQTDTPSRRSRAASAAHCRHPTSSARWAANVANVGTRDVQTVQMEVVDGVRRCTQAQDGRSTAALRLADSYGARGLLQERCPARAEAVRLIPQALRRRS